MESSVEICTSRASKYLRCSVWARKINSLKGSANSARTSSRVQSFRMSPLMAALSRGSYKRQARPRDAQSAKAAGDVVLGPLVCRGGEDVLRLAELDEFAQEHEGRVVGNARGLLHVMGHDGDRVVLAKLADDLFDLGRGDRINGRTGFIQEDELGLDRHRAGDAQPLLLAAGERRAAGVELVLDLVP